MSARENDDRERLHDVQTRWPQIIAFLNNGSE